MKMTHTTSNVFSRKNNVRALSATFASTQGLTGSALPSFVNRCFKQTAAAVLGSAIMMVSLQANAELTTSSSADQVKRLPVAVSNNKESQPLTIDSLAGAKVTQGNSSKPIIQSEKLKPFNPNESADPLVTKKLPVKPEKPKASTQKTSVKPKVKNTKPQNHQAQTKPKVQSKPKAVSKPKKATSPTSPSKYTNVVDVEAIKNIENKNGKTFTTLNLTNYATEVNGSKWSKGMKQNSAMTVKLQALLDWNHASPGPIDGGWGMNSKKALKNLQAMKGLPVTGRMNQATWKAMTRGINVNQPVLVQYTITANDVNSKFVRTPAGSEAKSKLTGLYYQNIHEMLAERFHMNVNYLKRLNKNKKFAKGEIITVFNSASNLNERITRVVANKADETLYAYNGNKLVATYPTTVGSSDTPSPHGTFKIVNKVKMPWYKATIGEEDDKNKKVFMLPPGPNNPVGLVWMGLSKPSFGLHGSPIPEGISRQASHGCIRLTNWDVLEVYANIRKGAVVELK